MLYKLITILCSKTLIIYLLTPNVVESYYPRNCFKLDMQLGVYSDILAVTYAFLQITNDFYYVQTTRESCSGLSVTC